MADDKKNVIKELADNIWENKEKVLFIIGAGASASAGIPTSDKVKKELLSIVSPEVLKEILLEAETPVVNRDTDITKLPLEMLLTAYAEFAQEKSAVYDFLKLVIKKKEPLLYTPLGYEVLSHFVKHKIVRYIISLNFDELLEKALDNEIGEEGYEKIRSRSAFDKLKEKFDRLKEEKKEEEIFKIGKPFLLKPHGTMSTPLTLRPTWQTVQKLEYEKKEVIKRVLDYASVIVIVGYSMKDKDIQSVLLPFFVSHPEKTIYYVTKAEDVDNQIEQLCEMNKGYVIKDKESDDFFQELGDKLENVAKNKDMFFSPISEHKIRTVVFKAIDDNEKKDEIEKIEDKLKFEILLTLTKTKGLVVEKYLWHHRRIKKCISELRTAYKKEENKTKSLNEIIKESNLAEVLKKEEPGMDFYYIETENNNKVANNNNELTNQFTNQIIECISNNYQIDPPEIEKDIEKLMNNPDYDLGMTPEVNFLFKNPKMLFTREDFENQTKNEIIKKIDSNKELCIITETGEWINRIKDSIKNNIKIKIITSDPYSYPENSFHKKWAEIQQKDLKNLKDNKVNAKIKCIDFLTNKHHMTILKPKEPEKSEESRRSEEKAVYFYREFKSPEFVPIWLTDKDDIKILKDYFEYLWKTATCINKQ